MRDVAEGIDWTDDFDGLFEDEEREADGDGLSKFRGVCVDGNDWLDRASTV